METVLQQRKNDTKGEISTILTSNQWWNDKAFALRQRVFAEKYGVDNFPAEDSLFSGETWWILGLDTDQNIIGTIRLLYDSNNEKDAFKLRISKTYELPFPDHECLELGSIYVAPEYRETNLSMKMASNLLLFFRKHQIKYVCGIVDGDFAKQFANNKVFRRVVSDLTVSDQPIMHDEYGIYRYQIGAHISEKFLSR